MKLALITGATSGFGEAIARRLANENWKLIITGRRNERLERLKKELNEITEVKSLVFDVRSNEACKNSMDSLDGEWREIDVLVNNAGLALGKESIQDGNIDQWDTMIDTNVKGLLYMSKLVSNIMIENGSGHILNIGSTAGKEVYPGGNVYCASKHAVDAISKALRVDLLPYGIRVTQICPGVAETEFSKVRFGWDEAKANKVYDGYSPLVAEDIADVASYALSLPEHVCLNDVVVTCTAQANSEHIFKSNT